MDINIIIDKITNCLEIRESGEVVETYYVEEKRRIKKTDCKGWKFDWTQPQKNGYHVFTLYVKGKYQVQGRIAVKIDGGVGDIDIVETAPHNYGHKGIYSGVGAHLFAIACKYSLDHGCDGFVAFTAKSTLIDYYHEKLGAQLIAGRRMYINDVVAKDLIARYLKEGEAL